MKRLIHINTHGCLTFTPITQLTDQNTVVREVWDIAKAGWIVEINDLFGSFHPYHILCVGLFKLGVGDLAFKRGYGLLDVVNRILGRVGR